MATQQQRRQLFQWPSLFGAAVQDAPTFGQAPVPAPAPALTAGPWFVRPSIAKPFRPPVAPPPSQQPIQILPRVQTPLISPPPPLAEPQPQAIITRNLAVSPPVTASPPASPTTKPSGTAAPSQHATVMQKKPTAPAPPAFTKESNTKSPTKAESSLPTSPGHRESDSVTRPITSASALISAEVNASAPFLSSTSILTSPPAPPPSSQTRDTAPVLINAKIPDPAASRLPSPETVKPLLRSPLQSSHIRPQFLPVSPVASQYSQMKASSDLKHGATPRAEQKTVLVPEGTEKSTGLSHTSGHYYLQTYNGKTNQNSNVTQKEPQEEPKHKSNIKKIAVSEGSMVTLVGENKGAIIGLSSALKNSAKPASGSNKSDDETGSKTKENNRRYMALKSSTRVAFINSNVQGVNNSILYDCSCNLHDQGLHLTLSRKTDGARQV